MENGSTILWKTGELVMSGSFHSSCAYVYELQRQCRTHTVYKQKRSYECGDKYATDMNLRCMHDNKMLVFLSYTMSLCCP